MQLEHLTVGLDERSYSIWIGHGILPRLPEALREVAFPCRVAVVSNPRVMGLFGEELIGNLRDAGYGVQPITVPDGEQYKNWQVLQGIYTTLIEQEFDRHCGLIALGGGVIGDMTGFAAATFLRGVPFVQVPTTLLAQVDSSVGGKTAINHELGKNLIGAFYQPRHVHVDVATLRNLDVRDFAAGMAEIIKYGVIRDRDFFQWLRQHREALRRRDPQALIAAVKRSCQIKANIVEIDETEKGQRAILNFGHTFGHAVETLTGYRQYRHGEAVAIGMVVAAAVAHRLSLCSAEDAAALKALLEAFDLPVTPPDFPLQSYLQAMRRDKKMHEGRLRLVLNRGIGDCELRDVFDPADVFGPVLATAPGGPSM